MKLATKLILSSICILVIGFNIGTSIFINSNFNHSLDYYINTATNNFYTQKYLFESKIATHLNQNHYITKNEILEIIGDINRYGIWTDYFVDIRYNNEALFNTDNISMTVDFSEEASTDTIHYKIVEQEQQQILIFKTAIKIGDAWLELTFGEDISSIFSDGKRQLNLLIIINLILVITSSLAMWIITTIITRGLKKLENATARITQGDFTGNLPENGNDEIALLSKRFNLMAKTIKSNMHELDTNVKNRELFVANFSHELKTPLTSMIGYADFIRREEWENSAVLEASDYIYSQSLRLQNLSQKMLQLMELKDINNKEKTTIELKEQRLISVFEQVAIAVKPILGEKNINLKFKCSNNFYVLCDKILLQSLMINLVTNAIKASFDDGEIIVGTKIDETGNKIIVYVKDFGIGIAKDVISNITDEFFIVDKSRKGENNGIGLAIAKEIAKLHKTKLAYESELGEGTIVAFALSGGTKND